MKRIVTTVAYHGHYAKGLARIIREFARHSPFDERETFLQGWLNTFPTAGMYSENIDDSPHLDGYNYMGYCIKPFALQWAAKSGAELGLLIDASVYPIADISPLWDFIAEDGYYFGASGFKIGQWVSDRMLGHFGLERDSLMNVPEVASGVVGLDFRRNVCRELLKRWCDAWPWFPGPHSNIHAETKEWAYRNEGFCSNDPRCLGHRHDQSALSIIAHQMGFTDLTPWPRFVSYGAAKATSETCLVIEGIK